MTRIDLIDMTDDPDRPEQPYTAGAEDKLRLMASDLRADVSAARYDEIATRIAALHVPGQPAGLTQAQMAEMVGLALQEVPRLPERARLHAEVLYVLADQAEINKPGTPFFSACTWARVLERLDHDQRQPQKLAEIDDRQ